MDSVTPAIRSVAMIAPTRSLSRGLDDPVELAHEAAPPHGLEPSVIDQMVPMLDDGVPHGIDSVTSRSPPPPGSVAASHPAR